MDTNDAPPVRFTLRPHHLNLLLMITLLFKHFNRLLFSPAFLLCVHEIIIVQISESVRPKTHSEILEELNGAPGADSPSAMQYLAALDPKIQDFGSVDRLTSFMSSMSPMIQDIPGGNELHRRSYYGYFCRRCMVAFLKLSFTGAAKLREDHHEWLMGNIGAGYDLTDKEPSRIGEVLWKTTADESEWASPQAYAEFERALAINDSNVGSESIRQFFEQHFHEGNDSGLRQHALLNLSRMHYLRSEYPAARKFLLEAINVARTAGDKETLQHCQSLLHRLPPVYTGEKLVINDVQPALHPLEVLFDVEKLMRFKAEQPLSAAFEKWTQAIGLYDHWIDAQGHIPDFREEWGQHAVQATIWSAAGCEKLAQIEEDIVTLFTEVGGDDNSALIVALNRAYRRARQGEYREALADLLEPDVWRGILLVDYGKWSWQIWQILALRASRRGQVRFYENFLSPRRAPGPFNPRDFFQTHTRPAGSGGIRDSLFEAMELRNASQPAHCIEHLLRSLWHAEYQFRFGYYRTGMIMLADAGLEFGMTKRAHEIVQNILPQVITGNDLEQRALACVTFARCNIAARERSPESLREAVRYLQIAEADYAKIECLRPLADVQYMLSVVYHNLNMESERNEAASRNLRTEKQAAKDAAIYCEDWVSDVWLLNCEVGVALGKR